MNKFRELKVSSLQEGLKRMQAFLFANMIDNELEVDDPNSENPRYFTKLVWLYRDVGGGKKVGCPCVACDFKGLLPNGEKIHGIVYVKIFAGKEAEMVKMHIIKFDREEGANYEVEEIYDGEQILMRDENGRYEDEIFLFQNGQISKID